MSKKINGLSVIIGIVIMVSLIFKIDFTNLFLFLIDLIVPLFLCLTMTIVLAKTMKRMAGWIAFRYIWMGGCALGSLVWSVLVPLVDQSGHLDRGLLFFGVDTSVIAGVYITHSFLWAYLFSFVLGTVLIILDELSQKYDESENSKSFEIVHPVMKLGEEELIEAIANAEN